MEYLLILLGAIVAGFFGAGVILIINLLFGRRLPGWSTAVAAGVAMLGMTIYLEYDWFKRRTAELPQGVEVAWQNGQRQIWRPWTFIFPLTTRFIAMDVENVGVTEANPELRMVDTLFVQRWTRDRLNKVVFDCNEQRNALIGPDTTFGPDGTLEGVDWDPVSPDDPVLQLACEGGENNGAKASRAG
ncbi:MAG: hypothetical protein AAGJ28_20050 [Pseudomonadota bacterium]